MLYTQEGKNLKKHRYYEQNLNSNYDIKTTTTKEMLHFEPIKFQKCFLFFLHTNEHSLNFYVCIGGRAHKHLLFFNSAQQTSSFVTHSCFLLGADEIKPLYFPTKQSISQEFLWKNIGPLMAQNNYLMRCK